MTTENETNHQTFAALPYEVTRNFPGKHIVFSEHEQRVIGVGATLEEATAQAKASGVKGLWHYGYGEVPGIWNI